MNLQLPISEGEIILSDLIIGEHATVEYSVLIKHWLSGKTIFNANDGVGIYYCSQGIYFGFCSLACVADKKFREFSRHFYTWGAETRVLSHIIHVYGQENFNGAAVWSFVLTTTFIFSPYTITILNIGRRQPCVRFYRRRFRGRWKGHYGYWSRCGCSGEWYLQH